MCGVEQLATGFKTSIEGAIHAMTDLYNEFASDSWGFLLIDAVNDFNMLNQTTALWNVRVLWPRCSRFLFNTYRGYECISSKVGVTQGDTQTSFFYAVAVVLLIRSFASKSNFAGTQMTQCAQGSWFDKLIQLEPAYGYYAEPTNLGGVFCTQEYCSNFMKQKVNIRWNASLNYPRQQSGGI